MFALVGIMRVTGVEISQKAKMWKTNCIFEKFENTVNLIYTVWAILEMII